MSKNNDMIEPRGDFEGEEFNTDTVVIDSNGVLDDLELKLLPVYREVFSDFYERLVPMLIDKHKRADRNVTIRQVAVATARGKPHLYAVASTISDVKDTQWYIRDVDDDGKSEWMTLYAYRSKHAVQGDIIFDAVDALMPYFGKGLGFVIRTEDKKREDDPIACIADDIADSLRAGGTDVDDQVMYVLKCIAKLMFSGEDFPELFENGDIAFIKDISAHCENPNVLSVRVTDDEDVNQILVIDPNVDDEWLYIEDTEYTPEEFQLVEILKDQNFAFSNKEEE